MSRALTALALVGILAAVVLVLVRPTTDDESSATADAPSTTTDAPPPKSVSPLERHFEEVAPRVGDALPDLALYDEQGGEVRLRELVGGHHTVLVFGCLT